MLRAAVWLGKVRIARLYYRILIPMSKLSLHGGVSLPVFFVWFHRTLAPVLVPGIPTLAICHDDISQAVTMNACISLLRNFTADLGFPLYKMRRKSCIKSGVSMKRLILIAATMLSLAAALWAQTPTPAASQIQSESTSARHHHRKGHGRHHRPRHNEA